MGWSPEEYFYDAADSAAKQLAEKSPGGACELSPALQRWEKRKRDSSPGGTTEFSSIF
jgi:hypothetical protein